MFQRFAGARRFAYNWAIEQYVRWDALARGECQRPSAWDLHKQFVVLKKQHGNEWTREVSKWVFERGIDDAVLAVDRFENGQGGEPHFQRRRIGRGSFRFPQSVGSLRLKVDQLFLPKIGWVRLRVHRPIVGRIKQVTVKELAPDRKGQSRWEIIILTDNESRIQCSPENQERAVGIDLGIHHAVATSDGRFFENPRFYRSNLSRLRTLGKEASRRINGSKNWLKTQRKVARLHARVANRRRDWAQKLTTELCREYGIVAIEDLHVRGMVQNHRLAQSISDVGLAMIRSMLAYKAQCLRVCDRFDPTSKTCSACGWKDEAQTLADRVFRCEECGLSLDRDTNAAINILKWAHGSDAHADAVAINACKQPPTRMPVEPTSIEAAMKQEAVSGRKRSRVRIPGSPSL